VTRHTLENGLTVLVRENPISPTAVLRGYLGAGAVCETDETAGLARLTAATTRRGTEARTFQEINEAVESVGARFEVGGGRHQVGFSGKSLSEDLPLIVEIAANVLRRPTFPVAELEKVRGQTITSLRQLEDDTQRKAHREFRALCYPGHPYGRPVEGTLETVQRIQRPDLIAFYEQNYGPQEGVIAVVGDVTTDAAIARLEEAFAGWPPPEDDPSWAIPSAPHPKGAQRVVVPMLNKTQVDLVWGLPALSRANPNYYAARLANAILGQVGLMGRLGANVRDKQGLAYYASSALQADLGEGPWLVFAGVDPGDVDRAIESILAEIERLRDEPVTEGELADAQDYITGVLPLRLETNHGVAGALIEIEMYGLGLDFLARYPALIRGVTREQVQAVARKYLDPENYALVIAGPYEKAAT
jgi:zinc protease